jgi:hypothetical protein
MVIGVPCVITAIAHSALGTVNFGTVGAVRVRTRVVLGHKPRLPLVPSREQAWTGRARECHELHEASRPKLPEKGIPTEVSVSRS